MTTLSKLTKLTSLIIACGLILNAFLSTAGANAAVKMTSSAKPACGIEIDNAHISRHMLRTKNTRGVLVSARSRCHVLHSEVFLTVQLYKVEKFGNHLLKTISTDPNNPKSTGYLVRNNAAFRACKNFQRTRYFGIAISKAVINGQWKYAGRVRSEKTIEINCGT